MFIYNENKYNLRVRRDFLRLKNTKWIGKERLHFEEIDSTNKKAKELAEAGCPNGLLITADTQTAGTGRRGRSWASEKGSGIYMSLLLRPDLQPNEAPMLTLVSALAVAKAITCSYEKKRKLYAQLTSTKATCMYEQVANVDYEGPLYCRIKWPNDIVINGKKICGILTEMTLNQSKIGAVILGIGINVSNTCFDNNISSTASSLYLESNFEWESEPLIEEIWIWFEFYYALFLETKDLSKLKAEYEEFLINKNEKVNVLDPLGVYTGIANGIRNTGELLVETEAGIKTVSGGEVSVRGIYGYV